MEKIKRNKHRWWKILLIILSVLILLSGAELLYSNYAITASRYSVSSEKVTGSFRIVFLSDLHGREFGSGNSRLLTKISAEEPDLIVMAGDIIDSGDGEVEVAAVCAFIRSASIIAPVYFSLGNHETVLITDRIPDLEKRLSAAGAVVLDNRYLDLTVNGTELRLGGYTGYYRIPHLDTQDSQEQAELVAFADDFENTDRFKLLLNHLPIIWLDWGYRNKFPVDLVLSGHYHGGVVRIPILEQGIYAPYVGFFPPYTKGLFAGKEATCILTTGLAGSYGLPRFFNPPEIVVVDVTAS